MLQSNGRAERLLLVGSWGSGKTTAYFKIAEWLHNTGSPAQMFIIDPDYKAALDPNAGLPNVHIFDDLEHWTDYQATVKKIREEGVRGRGDWLVCDMMDKVWLAAQAGYTEQTFGVDTADFYIQWRKQAQEKTAAEQKKEGGNPFDADWGKDWQAINRLYDTFIFNLVRFPGNVLMTTSPEIMDRDKEKNTEHLRMYGKLGVKPAGQKRLGHIAADCLLMNVTGTGWTFSQIRGTGREEFKNEPINDFVMSYLVGRAGWTL